MGLKPNEIPENLRRCIPKVDRLPLGKAGVTTVEANEKFERNAERKLHEQITGYLRIKGVRFICHSRMDRATTTAKGVPDFLFGFRQRFIALEAKVGNNKLTPEQQQALVGIIADGGLAETVRSLDDVKRLLDFVESTKPAGGPSAIPPSYCASEPEPASH